MKKTFVKSSHRSIKSSREFVKSGLMMSDDEADWEKFENFAGDVCHSVMQLVKKKMEEYGADFDDAQAALNRLEPDNPSGYMSFLKSSRKIQSSLKEELEKQIKERHLKLNPDGETPDLSAAVEYIEQNDDWYIGTDEQKARKWIRDTLENSDDLITSSMIKDKIQSSAIGKKLKKADKFSGGREVDLAFNSDSFADFKRHLAKAVDKANQNGSRMFRDKWEDIEFTEPEMKYLFNGPDEYNLPTSTERTLSPEEKKQRKQWQDDFTYGESVHSIGYNED